MKVKGKDTEPVNSDDNYSPPSIIKCEDGKCGKKECQMCNPKSSEKMEDTADSEQDMALGVEDVHVPSPVGNPVKKHKDKEPDSKDPNEKDEPAKEEFAQWTGAEVDNLPDSSFAVISAGGKKDEEGKTVPRSLRHLPYKDSSGKVDLPHLRNALARLDQTSLSPEEKATAKSKLESAAKENNVGSYSEDQEGKQLNLAELNMEVFATGTWNGDKYTDNDLDAIVKSYQAIGERVKPYLKLGHNEGQKLAKDSGFFADGKPALGWVESLRKVGNKLVATFKDVPQVVADLVTKGAYKRVSSEIYTNYKAGDTTYPFVLKAVALLGADTPAVTTLHDVAAMYTEDNENTFKEVNFTKDFKQEEVRKMENEELEKQFAEKEELLKKEYAEKSAKMDEILAMFEGTDDLKKAVIEFKNKEQSVSAKEKEYTEHLARVKKEEVSKFVSDLVANEKLLPAQSKLAEGILLGLGDAEKKELSFTDAKMYGYKDKMSLFESLQKFMSAYPKFGLLKEYTSQKKLFNDKNLESEELVKQYMDEHKVDYGQAQLAVYAARPELFGLKLELTGEESEGDQD